MHFVPGGNEKMIAKALTLPADGGTYTLYYLFPMTEEQQTLSLVRRALVTAGILLLLVAGLTWLVTRQVVTPVRLAVTAALVILLAISGVIVVFTGGLAARAGDVLGVGNSAVTAWNIAKWPFLLLVVIGLITLLYWAAPNVRQPGFRWIAPGAALAVIVWIVASAAFAVYVATLGSYNKTYGGIAAIIVFLVWLWISNTAILLGQEFNAELGRGRAEAAGHPPGREPYVEPRDPSDPKGPDEPR